MFICALFKWNELNYNVHVASMDTKVAKEAVSDAKKSHYSTLMSRWIAFKADVLD